MTGIPTSADLEAGKAEREIGWLIERKYPVNSIGATEPRWYAERPNGDHWWTPVPNDAKRFASKAEAEAYPAYSMIAKDPAISLTEHVWINDGFSWSHGRSALIPPSRAVEPVAWRVKDYADGWMYFTAERNARDMGNAMHGALVEPLYAVPQAVAPTEEIGEPIGFAYQDAQWVDRGRWHLCKTEPNAINGRKVERVYREAALTALSAKLADTDRRLNEEQMQTTVGGEIITDLRRKLEAEQATTALQKRMLDEAYVEIRAYRAALTSVGNHG